MATRSPGNINQLEKACNQLRVDRDGCGPVICADDPVWWTQEEVDLLRDTRPGYNIAHYKQGIGRLRQWRARLCVLQRCLLWPCGRHAGFQLAPMHAFFRDMRSGHVTAESTVSIWMAPPAYLVRCCAVRKLGGSDLAAEEAGAWALGEEALKWAKSTVWSRAFNISYLGAPHLKPPAASRAVPTSGQKPPAAACMVLYAAQHVHGNNPEV